ncbi:hypothetical protein RS030_7992 [Cryptosporidium xiaoi]|uniref:Non-specific serine/threonine protein kinase n=1 Tax=Cryptosporidium xiaoi TaxID=659607 RepID=A0AAV9XTE7_9CRYT
MDISEISSRLKTFGQRNLEDELEFLTSIRDNIELYTSDVQAYSTFLNECLEGIKSILLFKDKLRKQEYRKSSIVCMEILTLLPHNEIISNYCLELAQLCLHILDREMDDIGVLAIRNLVFLHKNFTEKLEFLVESFLGFSSRLCNDIQHNLPHLIQEIISNRSNSTQGQDLMGINGRGSANKSDSANLTNEESDQSLFRGSLSSSLSDFGDLANPVRSATNRSSLPSGISNSSNSTSTSVLPCNRSLRILTELPLALLHIFQLYPHYIERYFAIFAPNLISCLNMASIFPREFHPKLPGSSYTSYNHSANQHFQISFEQVMDIISKPSYKSFIQEYMIACSKIALWFIHFFRSFNTDDRLSEALRQILPGFTQGFIEILLLCPPYCIQQRREILVCLRSILSTDIRQSFYDKADILLDETVLIGHGRTGYETVKVISSAIIHEMLVYLRIEYSNSFFNNMNQESLFDSVLKCLHSLTRNVLDTSLPLPAQHYCIRSLAFIPDILKKEGLITHNNPQKNIIIRDILLKIMWAFSMKLHQLRRQIYNLVIISLGKELPDIQTPRNDIFTSGFIKPTLKEFLDEFNEIANTENWLDNSFSYSNSQIGHCEVSLLGCTLPHKLDKVFDKSNQSKPLVIDILRELRPIIRATIIGARQTVFHITTLNSRGFTSNGSYNGNFNNKNFINTNSSGISNANNNNINLDITRYDVRKLSNGLMLNEKESKLLQKILIEGIICSIEYCISFQYTMSTSSFFHIREGGDKCMIIPTSSLIIPSNLQNQPNQHIINLNTGPSNTKTNDLKLHHFSPLSILPEERELLELLASTLCYIHPQSFGDIIQATFPLLFDWSTRISPQIALIFHYWGLQHHVSRIFYESILPHLISKLESLSIEPESEFKALRKNSSSLNIILASLNQIQGSFESISQNDISSIIAQANNMSSTPLTFSIYPIECEKSALSRCVIDPHIDLVEQHCNIPFSRGRISNYGALIISSDNKFSIIDPRDDPNDLLKFAPTTAPHGNPEDSPFPFDILTQNVNVSFLQINKDFPDLPIPDTFIYNNNKYGICDNNSNVIASGLVITRLFKQLFRYIGQNPQFEVIIIPHIVDLCVSCISMASKYQCNIFFLSILRSLFRSITPGGKASGIYREFLKILPWFLETAIKMHKITDSPFREIWLEISLTVPARLKSLLPYMGELIGPMIDALESNDPELVLLALRSLDLWIDNLHHDFLYPILTNTIYQSHRFQTRPSIIVILCKLLRPAPPIPLPIAQILLNNYPRFQKNNNLSYYTLQSIAFQHATVVGRVLGKLGGKNRWFLKDAPILEPEQVNNMNVPITISFNSSFAESKQTLFFKINDVLQHIYQYLVSVSKLDSSSSITLTIRGITNSHIKNLILFYLSVFWVDIGSFDNINNYFDFLGLYLRENFERIENPKIKSLFSMDYLSLSAFSTMPSYFINIELLTKVIILASSTIDEFSSVIGKNCEGLTTFLAIYSASRSFIPEHSTLNLYWSSFNTDPVTPILSGLFETIEVQFVTTPKKDNNYRKPALVSLEAIKDLVSTYYNLVKNFPSFYVRRALQTAQLPTLLSSNIVTLCYENSREKKTAASLLIIEILNCIPPDWSQVYFTRLSDSLFFVSKDSEAYCNSFGERCSEDALECLIYSVFSGIKPNAILNKDSSTCFSLPQTKYGNTITQSKLVTVSGEQISTFGSNWDDFIKMITETNKLKENSQELWWTNSHRVYMEMLIFDSKENWFSGSLIRNEIFNSLGESIPSEEVLNVLRGHLNHLFISSIVPNILSLSSSCRRMAQKCLCSLSHVTGVSVATLLNISFNNLNEVMLQNGSSTQTTLLQLLLSRLQTKLISTCSIPYQLAFLDALCFIASLRPTPIGIPSTVIRRFIEDIIVLIKDEVDIETNESQKGLSNSQTQANTHSMNHQNTFNKDNPDIENNRIKVQIYSIKFLKQVLIHPIWSEFLRNRPQISSHTSSSTSSIVNPIIQTSSPIQTNQSNTFQQVTQSQSNQVHQGSHLSQGIQFQQQQIQNLTQNVGLQTQITQNLPNQGIHQINQQKSQFSHQVYQNQYQNSINQQVYSCVNQLSQQMQSKPLVEELRWRIIGILLRCVTRKDLEICKAAHHALRVIVRIERFVLNQQISHIDNSSDILNTNNVNRNHTNTSHYELLPEDQLRHCLRPVLVQLASATRLTVHLLQGLARLLELLCFCFNVTLGEKLLQHLQKLCWPTDFQQRDNFNTNNYVNHRQVPNSSTGFVGSYYDTINRHEEDLQMAIAMVCIFHLLPQGSDEFVAKVIGTVLGTRSFPGIDGTANGQSSVYSFITSYVTNMTISSPFRLPLALFSTHSPHNVVMFLIQQLSSDRYANFLIDLIRIRSCSVVRVKLYQYRAQLIDSTLNKVLKEIEYFETKRDIVKSVGQSQVNNSIQTNIGQKSHSMTQNINKKMTHSVPSSPAYTEIYSSAWNGIRVLSNLCDEWPSILIIDFLEYYSSTNKSNLTIIDALLTLYNTIFNRLIVLSRTGGILNNGNYDNKFELALGYQGSVSWQHPWSFFHSNECFLLFKMLIGFYSATNALNNPFNKNLSDKSETYLGKEVVTDIESIMKSMKSVLVTSLSNHNNTSVGSLSQTSPVNYHRQGINEGDHIFSANNSSYSLSQVRPLNQNGSNGVNIQSPNNNNIQNSSINSAGCNQILYPSKELIYSLLLNTTNTNEVKEHLKRRRIDVVLTIATLFGTSTTIDTGPLRDFLIFTVPKTLTIQEKRLLFNQLLQRYYPNNPNIDTSTILPGTQLACIQLILIPLLEFEFNRIEKDTSEFPLENSWLNENIYEGIILRIVLPTLERGVIPLHGTFGLSATDDILKIETLKLLIIIIKNKYFDETLSNNRKRVVKNVWNILRTESSLLKSWGYIAMCYFVKKYPFPDKILFSMLVSLIRLYSISEVRMIVRRALDLFIPLLYSIKPISYELDQNNLISTNQLNRSINRNTFSLIPSPPKLSIRDRTPEKLFSNWIRLMVAILIQDSCNLPLQQQLYHWNIITLHPDILFCESIYLLSPILSTVTKLLWGYYPINPNFNHNYISNTLINQSCGYSGQGANSQYSFPTSTNVPFLPEIKRNIFDVMMVVTNWICNINETINSVNIGNEDSCSVDSVENKKRKLSPESTPDLKSQNKLKMNANDYVNSSIDISSIPYLSSLLDSDEKKYISLIDLIITVWFRLALLSSNSDHQMVAKSFNIISNIIKKNPYCKVQYNWLDLGYSYANYLNTTTQNRINTNSQNGLSSNSNSILYSSQTINNNHIAFHLTIIAGIQVIIRYQSPSMLIVQLNSLLQILDSAIISGERVVTDSLYSLICKLVQMISEPSKQLKQMINEFIENVYNNIDHSNKHEFIKRKELEYSYIKNYRTPLTRKFKPDNNVDLFYIKLLEISVSGIWSIFGDLPILPESRPIKFIGKNKAFDRPASIECDQNFTLVTEKNKSNNNNNIGNEDNYSNVNVHNNKDGNNNNNNNNNNDMDDDKDNNSNVNVHNNKDNNNNFNFHSSKNNSSNNSDNNDNGINNEDDDSNKPHKNISLYTSIKITQSLLAHGILSSDISKDIFISEKKHRNGLLFLKYLSPLIIYTLNRILQLISGNTNAQSIHSTYLSSFPVKHGNMRNNVFIAPKVSGTSTNYNTISQAQNLNTVQNILTLNICCEFLQILFISPSVTIEVIGNSFLRDYSIQLLRDFGLSNFQGGIVHNIISIIGRWLFGTQLNLNSYLFEKLQIKLDGDNCFNSDNSEHSTSDSFLSLNSDKKELPKVVDLDDILRCYCQVKSESSREVDILNFELVIILLTSWSFVCDRNRKYEVHLIYHSFLKELLNEEDKFLNLKTEICEKMSLINTDWFNLRNEFYSEADSLFSNCKIISYLERCALLSLASPHPVIKEGILSWFNKKLPSDIMERFHYLFTSSSFDVLAERFYITEFLELIIPSLTIDETSTSIIGRFATILPSLERGTAERVRSKYLNNHQDKSERVQDNIAKDELNLWEIGDSFFANIINYEADIGAKNASLIELLECDSKVELLKKTNSKSFRKVLEDDKCSQILTFNKVIEDARDRPDLILKSLLFFSNTDEEIAINTWKTIFPFIWGNLTNKQKDSLTSDIIDLLSKERHHRISSSMPSEWTIPHIILEGLILCKSPPILPTSLLLHLSTKLRCWHIAGDYLKNQMHHKNSLISDIDYNSLLHKSENNCEDIAYGKDLDNSWMILAEIYSELQEEDIVIGIRRAHSNCIETHAGLALMQQAEWSRAQEIFYNNLDKIYCLNFSFDDKGIQNENNKISCWYDLIDIGKPSLLNNEVIIWIDSWVACAKHLNQWNTLNEFAKERKNPQLQLECSSKLQDWVLVEKLVNKYILHNPVTKLCQAYHSLYDLLLGTISNNWSYQVPQEQGIYNNVNYNRNINFGNMNSGNTLYYQNIQNFILQNNISKSKLSEFERHCSVGYKTVLNFWAMLPSIVSVCHIPLLLNFQQYVELQEGFRLSSDIEKKLYQDNNFNQTFNNTNIHNNLGMGMNLQLHNNGMFPQGTVANNHISVSGGMMNVIGNLGSYSASQGLSSSSTPGYFEARMLNVWRDRLPNKWDSMILWNDLFVWRNFVFSIIMNLISRSDYLSPHAKSLWPSYLQDMPWTMIKFASIARKSHRLPEVSVALLQRLQNHLQLSGGDAYRAETFLATIEKVKLCLSDNSQLRTGLNILNMTDFQKSPEPYFDEYRAELLRLKGIILNKLYPNFYIEGDTHNSGNVILGHSIFNSDSGLQTVNNSPIPNIGPPMVRPNTDLLSSLKVYPLFARGWITWAQYTDRLLYIHQNMSYAVNAVISYLMGIYLRPDKYSILLSRILWLLPHDSPEGKYLSLAFIKYSDFLPCAVWLPWIPQLIAGLDRIEGNALMHILNKITTVFPQSIYFNIRSIYLEKREMGSMYWYSYSNSEFDNNLNKNQAPPPSSGIYPTFISLGWQRIETIMNNCRQKHGALTLALEHWVEDLVLNCKPDPLDELLCAIRTLFQMTVDIFPHCKPNGLWENYCNYEEGSRDSDFLPKVGVQFLEQNVIKRYEQLLSKSANINNKSFERSRNVIKQFWDEFKDDFNVYKCDQSSSIEKVPLNLKVDYVLQKLKKWKDYFTKCTEKCSNDNFGGNSLLPDLSSTLCDLFHRINIKIEVPGQNLRISSESLYLRNFAVLESSSSSNPIGGVIYLDRPLPIVETVIRQSYTLKRIGFITSNGGTIHFLIQPYSGLQQKVEERILHLQVALNSLLYRYKETRSRSISFTIQPCVPLHPRCRIIEDSEKKSIAELVEEEAIDSNNLVRDLDIPVLMHRRLLNIHRRVSEDLEEKLQKDELLKIYSEICENWVPGDILRRNLLKRFRSHDQSFTFIKQFTCQIGILSIFSYILGVNEVTPNKIFLSIDTGQVYQSELKSSYVSSTLIVEKTERVPFRLTRNMENLMGPFGKVGVLPGSMLAFVHCLQKYEFHVRNLLCSLIRDDLYTFSMHRAIQVTQIQNKETDKVIYGRLDGTLQYNSQPVSDETTQSSISKLMQERLLSNVEIREKVDRNVRRMMEKIAMLTNPRPTNNKSVPIDRSILELIECSTDKSNLSAMKPTWMPWL